MTIKPKDLSREYYDFSGYVNRARWLTYFHQLELILRTEPASVLEIGVGPGIVRAVLQDRGVAVTTVDVNPDLEADHVGDVRELPESITSRPWDWVLCSRVLHHIPFAEVPSVIKALGLLSSQRLLITVPREDLSFQLSVRRTAGKPHQLRINLGSRLKRALRNRKVLAGSASGVWMLGDKSGVTQSKFRALLEQHLTVDEEFILADDPSHVFFACSSRR